MTRTDDELRTELSALKTRLAALSHGERISGRGSWIWDAATGDLTFSEETVRLLGLAAPEDASQEAVLETFFRSDDGARLAADLRARFAEGLSFESGCQIGDSDVRALRIRGEPVRDEAGALTGLAGVMEETAGRTERTWGVLQDILHARATEKALRKSQAQLVRAQRVAGVGSWYRDPQSPEAVWSDEVYAILGRKRGTQATSLEFLTECIHPADRDRYLAARARVFRDGEGDGYDLELRIVRPNGEIRFVRMLAEYDRAADGHVTGITGVIQDITQFKAATDALAHTKLTLDSFLEASPEAVIITDPDARVTVFSRGAETIFGYSAHEILGQPVDRLIPLRLRGAHDATTHPLADCAVAADMQHSRADLIGLRKGGEEFPAQASLSRLDTPAGALYAAILRDVGPEQAAREELIRAKEGAEAASRAKSAFLANMSHEIRTPMNGVLGMAAALQDSKLDDRQARMVGTIRQSGDLLMEVINNVLDISKIEAGAVEFERVAFSPRSLMEKIESVHALKAREKGLRFSVAHGAGGSGTRLGDPTRLQQILHNLVSNALKFTDHGGVVLRLGGDAATLVCEVGDTGAGMTPEQCVRVLEPFTQADGSITRKHGGTGLGLSIVKGLVHGMGGELNIESVPGQGTIFTVRLPFAATDEVNDPKPTRRDAAPESALERRLRILVADDNQTNVDVIEAMLERTNCALTVAENGERAVELFAPGAFDLVFMDIHMPRMGGEDALAAIRAKEAGRGGVTPVYALTADVLEHRVARYMALGFAGCIAKPIDMRKLMSAVEQATRSDGEPAALAAG